MRFVIVFVLFLLGFSVPAFSGGVNPYIPKEINIWVDKEFLKSYQFDRDNGYETLSTEEISNSEKELLKDLIEVNRLILKTNMIMIKQNERIIELLEKERKKGGGGK